MLPSAPQKMVILAGPTAVGKTAVLQQVQEYIQKDHRKSSAEYLFPCGIEVISCDSIQVYRHLNIGSAKPSIQFRTALPHHLIDILDPQGTEKFNAGDFVRECDRIIPQIIARRNIPVISGGTIFYLKSFLYGLADLLPISGQFRSRLEQMSLQQLGETLKTLDTPSWQRIHPNDKQRLIRACEVCLETHRPFSSYKVENTESKVHNDNIRQQYQILIIKLNLDREKLYQRINLRVEQMFEQGLEQEILFLKQLGLDGSEHSLQGIGYREFFQTDNKNFNKEQLIADIQKNSRRYAKRQISFLQQLPNQEQYSAENLQQIATRIIEFYLD